MAALCISSTISSPLSKFSFHSLLLISRFHTHIGTFKLPLTYVISRIFCHYLLEICVEIEITGPHTANQTCDRRSRWHWDVTDHPLSLWCCFALGHFHLSGSHKDHMAGKWFAADVNVKQAVTGCLHMLNNLFQGWCLNISCECVEVWCLPSAMCTYTSWHHSVISCFETSLHVFMSPYSAFHGLSVSWLCLHISFFYLSIHPSGFLTAVTVFRKPNAILLCFSIHLFLNFLLSWLLVLLPSTFFLDVLFFFSPVVPIP